jgi:hypothetical protein
LAMLGRSLAGKGLASRGCGPVPRPQPRRTGMAQHAVTRAAARGSYPLPLRAPDPPPTRRPQPPRKPSTQTTSTRPRDASQLGGRLAPIAAPPGRGRPHTSV